ncbi:hypothetical protein ACFXDE_15900 [Kitasatospora sp. NPDC059408]|uniref:hypothetical protein n=1 Tax=Kitasatospora sp. NPDC059408 TaxID=3346823 RepID=UPI00367ABFC5
MKALTSGALDTVIATVIVGLVAGGLGELATLAVSDDLTGTKTLVFLLVAALVASCGVSASASIISHLDERRARRRDET